MAKKTARKTTTKGKTARKNTSAAGGASRTAAITRKTTKKKTRTNSTTEKSSRKKTAARKTSASSGKTAATRKKSTASRAAAAGRKKKTSVKKKTASKVAAKSQADSKKKTKTSGKSTPAPPAATGSIAKAKGAAASGTKKKSPSAKKSRSRKSLGARSVAEAASEASADADGYVYINGRRVRMISTGGKGVPKKSRSTARVDENAAQDAVAVKPIKTKLTAKELRHFRDLLLQKRAELVGDVSAMEEAALNTNGGGTSSLPIHMADVGSDTYDQDFILGLAETERSHLREIDDALRRIQDKTYGVCQMTGKPIPKARLNAKPWAKYTIEAARKLEGQWRR